MTNTKPTPAELAAETARLQARGAALDAESQRLRKQVLGIAEAWADVAEAAMAAQAKLRGEKQ